MDSTSKLNLEKLYNTYEFIGISLDDFDMLVETVIIDYKKKHDKGEIDYKKVEEEVRKRLEHFTRESFDSYKGSLTTINGYINEKFEKYDSYEKNLEQLNSLIAFIEKYEYIPEPTLIIDLLERNVLFKYAVQNLFEENKDIIIDGNISKIYNNDLLIEFIELYCMTNNIEIKEVEEDLLEGLSDDLSFDGIDDEKKENTFTIHGESKKKEETNNSTLKKV